MRTWNPFRELEDLRHEIDRTFANALAESGTRPPVAFLPGRAGRAFPLVNLSEDNDNLYVDALAPGVDLETLNLSVARNILTLSGEKPAPCNATFDSFHRSERAAGKFQRAIELPADVDSSRVEAKYEDGLLHVTLPKTEEAKPRLIAVKVN